MNSKELSYLDSRIFPKSNKAAHSQNQNESIVASRTEDETFVKNVNFRADTPSGSIYNRDKQYNSKTQPNNVGTWVSVIGVIPGHTKEVVQFFSKYGTILRAEDTSGNWIYIEYPTPDIAKKVVNLCSQSPQLISNRMAVSCVLGRIRSQYVVEKPKPPKLVEFVPKSKGAVNPEETVVNSIFDSIFG